MFKLKIFLPVVIGLLLVSSSVALAVITLPATPGTCTDAEKLTIPGCLPPINVSLTEQKKDGGLILGSLLVNNSATIMSKFGIGAASPIPNGPKLYIQDTGTGFLTLAMLKNTNLAGSSAISFNSGGADAFWGINGPNRLDANPNQVFMGNGNANGGFLFFTGGGELVNERMRITSTGNVGIGTTNPTTKLTVNGSVTIADGTQGAGKVLTSDANGKASWGTGGGGGTGLEALNKHYFITATTYNGNLGGVAGANTKCNADANAIAGKSYVAILYGQLPDYLNHNGQSFHRDFRLKFYNLSYGESRSVFAVGLNSIGPETDSSKYKNSGSFWRGDSLLAYHCLNWTSSALLKRAYLGNIGWSTGRGEVMMDVGMIDNVSDSGSCSSLKSLLCVER